MKVVPPKVRVIVLAQSRSACWYSWTRAFTLPSRPSCSLPFSLTKSKGCSLLFQSSSLLISATSSRAWARSAISSPRMRCAVSAKSSSARAAVFRAWSVSSPLVGTGSTATKSVSASGAL